jgi:serine O-acetyltransferase
MKIVNLDSGLLAAYVRRQLLNLLPMEEGHDAGLIEVHLAASLKRLEHCINGVKIWKPGQFDVLHSSQYCIFLYYLANTIWREERAANVCTRLFLLNKALNGIDCFYEIELPEVFFIGHSVGIVLAKATYGNHLVLYQNTTVGKNHGVAPILGDRVVLYPNSTVIGRCQIGNGSVVSQGVSVLNQNTPGESAVFSGEGNQLSFKRLQRNVFEDFFREAP